MTGTSWGSGDVVHGAITTVHQPTTIQLANGSSSTVHLIFNASNSCDCYSDTATEVNPLYLSCRFYLKY